MPDEEAATAPSDLQELSRIADYTSSIFPGKGERLPRELTGPVKRLEELLDEPMWLLLQGRHDDSTFVHLEQDVRDAFLRSRRELRKCRRVGLIIDSPGGQASVAYQIATLLRRHCGAFDAIVPRYAKSAATLLSLGGGRFFMGSDAQIGPLDVQLMDPEREDWGSALDEVQALERLNAAALEQFDQAMFMLLPRTGKKVETLLPLAMRFATDMARPLLEKIDTVHYTQQSRLLKVAEDYATRLLRPKYTTERSEEIARRLVNNYPEHGFVIDRDEASTFLDVENASSDVQRAIDDIEEYLTSTRVNVLGRLVEVPPDGSAGGH